MKTYNFPGTSSKRDLNENSMQSHSKAKIEFESFGVKCCFPAAATTFNPSVETGS